MANYANIPIRCRRRNLANEINDQVVEALMSTTEKHYSLVQRYYRLKGKLLGIEKLYDYDRYARRCRERCQSVIGRPAAKYRPGKL